MADESISQPTNDYLAGLNEPQREAVLHTDGPLMIIAGAGSGKTRVLTYRIAHLIHQGVDPFRILALTFTNKAASEMRHRIEDVIGTEARNIWMGTFHAIFARILRIEAEKIGYSRDFSIYDTDDSKSLISSLVKELQLDDKVYRANAVLNRISSAKNRLISVGAYNQDVTIRNDDENARMPETGRLYRIYQDRLRKANAMDFDDLLFNTNVLLRDHPDVRNKYQHKFRYVLVDEFQDTNISQYLITRTLAAVHQNICIVGDDAQSIYAFRGANIQNILNFEKDYPDLRVIMLEQNYRSSQNIVNAANSVILRNQAQLRKSVWTANQQGSLIDVLKATSDNEEGSLVATSIFEEKVNNSLHNRDFAILYRTNAQSRSFEEALRRRNIKYRIVGGLSFYQRKEIKDLIAYLRFTVNQNDEEAFKRIINLPKRGIGDSTIAKLIVAADDNTTSLWNVVSNITQFMGGRQAAPIENFATLIKSFRIIADSKDGFEAASHIAKHSGLLKELYEDKTVEGLARYENVQELLNAIKEFVDNPETADKSLSAFLQSVSLLTSADEAGDGDNDKVTLMTVHSAKGLEFQHVYIVGMEEDLFPSQMMLASRADLEEERRLFYVAITRARQKLTLTYADSRYRFGRLKYCEPSRFLSEIDAGYLNVRTNGARESTTASFVRNLTPRKPEVIHTTVHTPSPDFTPSDTSALATGMRVEHPKFGFGTVKHIDVNGSERKAKIDFEKVGEKTLLLNFAKLKIHAS